jgi:HD-GYP domain-containing protein (c-di-GMP phosphodiesterase class II)
MDQTIYEIPQGKIPQGKSVFEAILARRTVRAYTSEKLAKNTIRTQHHERLDGSGYPNGLMGDQIILKARILMVADVVEAISSHRPYRPGLGIDAALDEIIRGRGTHYDPKVVDACVVLFRQKSYVIPE